MRYRNAEEDLKDLIASVIIEENNNKELYSVLTEQIKDKMRVGKVSDLFNDNVQIEMFKKEELFWIVNTIFNIKQDKKYNPEEFFTKGEIDKIKSEQIIVNDEINAIELSDVVETIENEQWICGKEKVKNIVNFLYNGLLTYDKRVQRETKKVKMKNGGFVERIKTNGKSVREIKTQLINNEYMPTPISLNILKVGGVGNEVYDFDKNSRILRIEKNSDVKIQIIDGFHRIKGMMLALEEEPNLEAVMQINIFHKDLTGAGQYIIQQSKSNSINTSKLRSLDSSDIVINIANDLNKEGNKTTNFLFNQIGIDNDDVQLLGKYTTVEMLANGINKYWKLEAKDIAKQRKLKRYLVKFFNEVIGWYSKEYENIKESRKSFVLTQGIAFSGLMGLAKQLEGVDEWEEKLDSILESNNWKLEDKNTWNGINVTNLNLPTRQMKKIYDIFENLYNKEGVTNDR